MREECLTQRPPAPSLAVEGTTAIPGFLILAKSSHQLGSEHRHHYTGVLTLLRGHL